MIVASYCGPTCGGELFLHVLGALVLFGSVLTVAILAHAALCVASTRAQLLRRVGFWTTLGIMVPAWIAMYAGGFWVLGQEGLDNDTPAWATAGARIADAGALLVVLLLLGGWFSIRKPRLGPWVAGIATLYLVALAVAWFFMSAKPSL